MKLNTFMKFINLYFCQSVGDVNSIYNIIKMNPKYKHIIILRLPELEDIFSLFKDYEIYILKLRTLKINTKRWQIITRIYLYFFFNFRIRKINYADVYFFSKYYDYISFYCINKLIKKNNNNIHYYSYKDVGLNKSYKFIKKNNIPERINQAKYATGISFNYCSFNNKTVIIASDNILNNVKKNEIVLDDKIPYRKKFGKDNDKQIFLLETNYDYIRSIDKSNYRKITKSIVERLLNEGFILYIKGHPRLGTSIFLNDYRELYFVTQNIPAEFLDFPKETYILSLISTSLGFYVNEGYFTISLINLYKFNNPEVKKSYLEYIKNCNPKILLPNTLNDLYELLKFE